jgi:hypothetical protein
MCNDSGTSAGPSIQYQQVYAAGTFSGPVTISSLTFYWLVAQVFGGTDTLLGGTYVFSLSTTSAEVDGLSYTCLSCNLGPDNTEVLSVTIPVGGVLFGTSYTFNDTANFNYDPHRGNLLLDIVVSNQDNVPNFTGNSYTDSDDTGSAAGRAYFIFGDVNKGFPPDTDALVTTFRTTTATTAPEPDSALLLVEALVGFAIGFPHRSGQRRPHVRLDPMSLSDRV